MMRGAAVLGVLLACASAALARQAPEAPSLVKVTPHGPEDQGFVAGNDDVTREFDVENVSSARVRLRIASRTRGCVDARLKPEELGPGGVASLTIGTPSIEIGGVQRHGAVVEVSRLADGRGTPAESFTAWFSYTPDIEFEVVPAKMLVQATLGVKFERMVYVQRGGVNRIGIRDLACSIPGVRVTGPEPVPENPEVAAPRLSWTPDRLGVHEGVVEFNTDSVRSPRGMVLLGVRVRSPLVLDPPGVIVTGVPQGAPALSRSCAVRLRPGCAVDAARLRVRVPGEGVRAAYIPPEAADEPARLNVTIDPRRVPRSGARTVEVVDAAGTVIAAVPVGWFFDP